MCDLWLLRLVIVCDLVVYIICIMCVVFILIDMFWGIKRKNFVFEMIKVYKFEMYLVFYLFW